MWLKCPHCGYEWDYHGNLRVATCPSCKNGVDINKNLIDKKVKVKK